SIDTTSGENGGDLGFSNYGEFVEPFADALRDLEVGEVSRPVRTEFGTHLIYLRARRVTPLAEVQDEIVAQLTTEQQDEAWRSWVSERYDAAEVSVNPRYGEFDPETQRIVAAGPEEIPGAATPRPTPTQNPDAAPSPLG
ncbi:MAG: peptidylprolyl isomerase, partial [Actinobacteria bacterium]|nr:peptidylprolyl isomerase [Actinomycetota bacterium]